MAQLKCFLPHRLVNPALMIMLAGLASGCSRMDAETEVKVDYWQKQTNMMILNGPEKSRVFAWVYGLDNNAKYSGDSLHAIIEDLPNHQACITLTIKFGEDDRVDKHEVEYSSECAHN
ncbi:MAG: hypothetical protein GW763_05860 [Paraglaciecola sp.]|nr:hypothetical protein [Paraglaciecola sp.]NCT47507.1 hypothetical protein [Paraglaciecola sp.]